jgi:maltokinase
VGFEEDVAAWVVQQRWYAGKSHTPRFSILAAQPVQGATRYLLMDHAGTPATLYQVPLADADGAIVDATHDHGFAIELLSEMGVDTSRITASRVMTGEQSNTSIVFDEDEEPTIIVKLFRALHHGENPDVAVQRALSAVGSPFVPRFLGSLDAEWPDSGQPSGVARGTVAFAQQFLPGARDGWSIAVEEARDGRSFVEAAGDLGVAVAGVHAALAATLPTRAGRRSDATAAGAVWLRRLTIASAEVAAVAERRAAIDAVYRAASRSSWPRLQRVHGDLHLGQVLAVPGGGWRLVDFEGEPLRPMAERAAPDLPLRDIAGMLRSFDYAGIVGGGDDGAAWASEARTAFLTAYAAEPGAAPVDDILLRALVLDKAVYETVYEARNRPDWLPIPLAGIDAALT